jgi:probable phosphoglycerate mutase
VTVRDGLREVHAGALEMLGDAASVHTYLETVFSWGEGDLGRRMPGGEDGHEVFGRYDAVVREIAAGHDVAIAISHGAVIRSWCAARAVNLTPGYAARHALGNTGVIVLQGSPDDGWRAVTWEGSAVDGVARRPENGPAGQPVAHEG